MSRTYAIIVKYFIVSQVDSLNQTNKVKKPFSIDPWVKTVMQKHVRPHRDGQQIEVEVKPTHTITSHKRSDEIGKVQVYREQNKRIL